MAYQARGLLLPDFDLKPNKNNKRVEFQIRNIERLTGRGIRQGFFQLGAALKIDLNTEVLKKDKRGRLYTVRTQRGRRGVGRRRRHRASAPGQTPANLTGNYRKNIGYQTHGTDELEFGIRDGASYAGFLEQGTRRMSARPGVTNTVRKMQGQAEEYFSDNLESSLKKP